MRDVAISGIGMTSVGEHWHTGLRELAYTAFREAIEDADNDDVSALYVANAFGATMSSQSHLGALIADFVGLPGIEAFTISAADASGGAALRSGYLAVASGLVDTVAVLGVEKSTDAIAGGRVQARNTGLDADYESIHGATLPALTALLMRRYMHEYELDLSVFEGFSVNAHNHGRLNSRAMFRNQLRTGVFSKSAMVADPINLFDGAPDADGAACIILTAVENARQVKNVSVVLAGSAVATDVFKLQDRSDPLMFTSAKYSASKALEQAEVSLDQLDLIELHDSFTIMSTLALEAIGFAERGTGWQYAANGGERISLTGELPMSTFGGLKSRGNPIGATGLFQAVEATLQLRGEAGQNQVSGAKIALIQNMGGVGSTTTTHVLRALL